MVIRVATADLRRTGQVPVCPECGKREDESSRHEPDCKVGKYLSRLRLWEDSL